MGKLFKYLGEFKLAVFVIAILLIIQAYCELALPQYTSDLVDVGVQQGGIENAVPTVMRPETFESLCLFMTDAEISFAQNAYTVNTDGNYELNTKDTEVINSLNDSFLLPVLMLSGSEGGGQKLDVNQLKAGISAGMVTKEQILAMKEQLVPQLESVGESMLMKKAVLFVQAEYETLGLNLNKIQTSYLWSAGAKMLGFSIIMMTAAIFIGLLASQTGAKIGMNLRERVFKKVVSFSNAELNHFSTASLITRSTNDIQQIQMVSTMLLRMVLYAPILGIGGIIKVAHTRTGMGWIIGVGVGVVMMIVVILITIAMPKFKKMQILVDKLNLVSREILTGVSVIRAFSRERHEEKRFEAANEDLMKTQLFTSRVMTFMMPIMMFIMNGIAVLIVWMGAKGIDLGNLEVGDMMAFISYSMQIIMSFLMLTMIFIMLPRAGVAAARIDEVLTTKAGILDTDNPATLDTHTCRGIVSFEDVSFRYPGAEEDALEHISFTAMPGKTTAIIGSTGCGKSTLLNLIPRFYDVTAGRITIDDVDIRDISQSSLRELLGYVPQKGVLFSGTVASNIKFAGETVSDEYMKEAAAIAQADEFISEKPDEYESSIAQGGSNVSGGQKQRLSIARAIAKKPQVFLFDDSFSALDYKTDSVLRKALADKISDATILIVAQRISTILYADQIIVLDDGNIAGIGTHKELLANCESYREIASSQLSESELAGGMA